LNIAAAAIAAEAPDDEDKADAGSQRIKPLIAAFAEAGDEPGAGVAQGRERVDAEKITRPMIRMAMNASRLFCGDQTPASA
jgi:hypothetical protein